MVAVDREIGAFLAAKALVIEDISPTEVLVSSRGR
jgi:hypothetical protein